VVLVASHAYQWPERPRSLVATEVSPSYVIYSAEAWNLCALPSAAVAPTLKAPEGIVSHLVLCDLLNDHSPLQFPRPSLHISSAVPLKAVNVQLPCSKCLGHQSPSGPKMRSIGNFTKKLLLVSTRRWSLGDRMASCKPWNMSTNSKRRMFDFMGQARQQLAIRNRPTGWLIVMQGKSIQETICEMGSRHEAH